jgi:BON domain
MRTVRRASARRYMPKPLRGLLRDCLIRSDHARSREAVRGVLAPAQHSIVRAMQSIEGWIAIAIVAAPLYNACWTGDPLFPTERRPKRSIPSPHADRFCSASLLFSLGDRTMFGRNDVSDKDLLKQVNQRLMRSGASQARVAVTVNMGMVTLTGTLQHAIQRDPILKAVARVTGVKRVIDQMQLLVRKREASARPNTAAVVTAIEEEPRPALED